jgi:hypothetical protein
MESKVGKRAIGAVLAIGVAVAVLTGCTSATGEGADPAPSASGAVSREAQVSVYNRARACFQNLTSRDIDYYFSSVDYPVNDQDEKLSPLAGTLGRNAFVCAASSGIAFGDQVIYFYFTPVGGHKASIHIVNGSNFLADYVDPYPQARKIQSRIDPGDNYWFYAGGQRVDVTVDGQLKQFDKIKGYQFEVRIYDIG